MGKRAPLIWALCIVLGCSPALAFAAAGNVDTPQALLEVSDTPEEQAADADDAALENLAANPAKGPSSLMDEGEGDHAAGSSEEGAHADRAKSESNEEASTLGEFPNAAAEQTGASDLPESWIDPNPPVYHGATLNAKVFSVGDEIRVEGSFSDEEGIEASYYIRPIVKGPDANLGYQTWYSGYQSVTSEMAPGMYEVVGFQVQDRKGYVTWFYDPSKVDEAHVRQPYEPISLPDLCFLLGDKTKENLYKVLEGNHQVYAKGSDEPLSIRFDGDLSDFVFATVDRAHLPESNYDLRSGSTIITLSSAYLDKLSSGTHELTAWYSDGGNGIATFTVAGEEPGIGDAGAIGQEGSPDDADGASSGSKQGLSAPLAQTGDANMSSLLYLIAFIALAYLLVSCVAARKDERGPEGGRRTR